MSERQTVLITGGVGGLGLAMAKEFIAANYNVIAVDIAARPAELPDMAFIQADLTKADDRERLWDAVEALGRPVDILINNAAVTKVHDYTNAFTLSADRTRAEVEINFLAPMEMCRLFLNRRRLQGLDGFPAKIVNIGAPGGLFPIESIMIYSTTKAALHMFTMALRRQLRKTLVTVAEVFPPSLDTPLTVDLQVDKPSEHGAETIAQVAAEILKGIQAGETVILPHKQSRNVFKAIPQLDEGFVDLVNRDVKRREGWDRG